MFTWAINPKEASVGFIKKYLVANYPEQSLGEDLKTYRKALETAEKNGQLERLTGKGFSGTFRLVDGASKLGTVFGDAFENACIAMNEPKDLSVAKLRDYLGFYHAEYNTDNKPLVLKRALDRAVEKGWLSQISGKGFAGTYRLMHPYYPGPKELWGKDFVEPKDKRDRDEEPKPKKAKKAEAPATPKRKSAKKAAASDSEDDDEDDDDDAEEEAYKPSAKKRGAPTPRKTADGPPKKKAKVEKPAKKSKKAAGKKEAAPVVAKKSRPPPAPKATKGATRGRAKKQ